MHSSARCLLVALFSCTAAHHALAAAGTTVDDSAHGFRFNVPAGYVDYPEGRAPGVLHVFAHGSPDDPTFSLVRIQALGGTIDRKPLVRETVERAAHASVRGAGVELTRFDYRKVPWKGFELDEVVTWIAAPGDKQLLTMTTQVPLRKEAVQLIMLGPAAEEARVGADLRALLGSIDGESNWLSDAERSEKLGFVVGLVCGGIAGIALVFWLLRRRRRAQT
jgi:hypothetical protein